MRYDFQAIQKPHAQASDTTLNPQARIVAGTWGRRQGRRILNGMAACLIVAGHGLASKEAYSQSPNSTWANAPINHPLQGLNRLGRLMGWGVSDGYHATTRGNANPLHDIPPRAGWIAEPSGLAHHPAAARIRHEIQSVDRYRAGFYDPYIDYSMVSPGTRPLASEGTPQSIPGETPLLTPLQPNASSSELPYEHEVQNIAPAPFPSHPSPIPVPTPTPRTPKQERWVDPQEPAGIQSPSVPSILDSLPAPQQPIEQPPRQQPAQNPPQEIPQPAVGGYSTNPNPIDNGLTGDGLNDRAEEIRIAPHQLQEPSPSTPVDPLSDPILPPGTIDPLPHSQPPRGNLLREPAVPPGVDPLDEFRRNSAELRQTSHLKQRSVPKRIPRITNRIVEPIAR